MNTMTKREFITVVLISLIYPIEESWQLYGWIYELLYGVAAPVKMVSWFLLYKTPIAITWYLKFLSFNVAWVVGAVVMYRLARLRQFLRIATMVVVVLRCIDVLLFFVCFNTLNYTMVYVLISPITIIVAWIQHVGYEKGLDRDEPKKIFRTRKKADAIV